MNEPIKHHYVPQFLLRNFADAKEKLSVHRVADDKSFTSVVQKTGQITDGHTLYGEHFGSSGRNRTLLESSMSDLEGEAAAVIKDLMTSTATELSDEQKQAVCWLAGLQILRNRFNLGYIAHEVRKQSTESLSPKEFQTGLLSAALFTYLDAWSRRNDPAARPKEKWNPYAGSFLQFRWDIMRYRGPSLVVSDTFAAQSGIQRELRKNFIPTEQRWAMHGFIVPLHECERVTIALSPDTGLYLHRHEGRKRLKADDFNRYTVYSSRDFVAHNVNWPVSNPRLYKAMTEHMSLQRMLRNTMPDSF